MGRETTITLDEDVAAKLDREAERTGVRPDEIVNATLRRTLDGPDIQARPFRVRPRHLGKPLVDLECTGRVLEALDELERT